MLNTYLPFEIQISMRGPADYAVYVKGPGGDARGDLRLPTGNATYQQLAQRLQALDTDEETLVALGQILFDAMFQGAIKDVYIRSQSMLRSEQGLRIILSIGATESEVGMLPWEFMTDPDQGPLALLDAPIVRYLQLPASIPTLETQLPIKVLVTAAQTPPPTRIARELELVQAALSDLHDHVQIEVEEHLTPNKLQRLLRGGFHVWHFVGHGGFAKDERTAQLYFEDSNGDAQPVSALQLGVLLNRSGVRLIVLDACESARLATKPFRSLAPALIRAHIPAVIAMQFTAPEEATRAFASEFYKSLAEGFPIDACVTEGRKTVMIASGLSNADWGIPVVYTRASDGRLFNLPSMPTSQRDVSQPAGNQAGNPVADAPSLNNSASHITVPQSEATTGNAQSINRDISANSLEEVSVKRKIIEIKQRRLGILKNQHAYVSGPYAPPHLIMEIEDLERELLVLKQEVEDMGG